MQLDEDAGCPIKASDQRSHDTFRKTQCSSWLEAGVASQDETNPAQQFRTLHRRIWDRHTVTLRQDSVVILCNHAVSEQPLMTPKQYDIPPAQPIAIRALNDESVSGPDGRQHTPAGNEQMQCA